MWPSLGRCLHRLPTSQPLNRCGWSKPLTLLTPPKLALPFRPAHLARLTELKEKGVVVEAGAYADASASLLMMRAASEEEALELCKADIYWQNGVWVDLRARAFARLP